MMAYVVTAFSLFSGVDVSYKLIERLYSDSEVDMAINNLHQLILKKKGVKRIFGEHVVAKKFENMVKELQLKGFVLNYLMAHA